MLAFQMKERGESFIRYKRWGDDEWSRKDISPFFYVDSGEAYSLPHGIDGYIERSVEPAAYDGTELHRVTVRDARDMQDARQAADNHYEADIPFERRFFIDHVTEAMGREDPDIVKDRPHVAHLDIEIGTSGGGIDALAATEPVVSVSVYDEPSDSHTDLLFLPPEHRGDDAPEADGEKNGLPYADPDWDSERPGEVFLFEDESEMLSTLGRVLRKSGVEVLTGWNVEGFDMAYLISRMANLPDNEPEELSPLGEAYTSDWYTDAGKHRINATVKGIDIFDMAGAYRHLKRRDKPPNWKLDTVASYEGVDVGKIPFDTSRVTEAWERDPMEVMRYNRRDSVLTHFIDESLSILRQMLAMHRQIGVPLPDTVKNSVMVEMFVMSQSQHEWDVRRRILDSKRSDTNDFEGGNTKQPEPGLYEWVFSADVTSEYPNWVRAANLSPETVVLRGDPGWSRDDLIDTPVDGVKFLPHEERLGILPRAVDEMFSMKEEKTELREQFDYGTEEYEQADMERDSTKWLLNSIQGVTGMETHRLSKNEVSAAITSFGRMTVEKMVDVGKDLGFSFVYGDTDSAFFTDEFGQLAHDLESTVDCVEELASETNEVLPEWANEEFGITDSRRHELRVEAEKVARRAFFPNKKKRYTLWMKWADGNPVDKVTHTGWAIVRSDTSEVEFNAQKKTLEAMMHNKSETYITARLKEELQRVADGEYTPMELGRPQGSSKAFAQYGDTNDEDFENVPYFVAAMMSSNRLLDTGFRGGDKAWMLPVEGAGEVTAGDGGSTNRVNYLAIDDDVELPEGVRVNTSKCMDNVIGKVERIYNSLSWDLDTLNEEKRRLVDEQKAERTASNHHTLDAFTS